MKASLLFITYKHENFVSKAIRSAMAQDYPDLELVVCDDASSDDTLNILEDELRHCPPHITVVRAHSEKNVGLIANFNRGMAACSGDIIVAMSGDDISKPNRVSSLVRAFESCADCMLVYSDWKRIDMIGRPLPSSSKKSEKRVFEYNASDIKIFAGAKVYGAVAAYRKELKNTFGPMCAGKYTEDECYWIRALLLGKIRYIPEELVDVRTHHENMSNFVRGSDSIQSRKKYSCWTKSLEKGGRQNIDDIAVALEKKCISPKMAKDLTKAIQTRKEQSRLRRYSLMADPWKLWLGSTLRLCMIPPTFKTIRKAFRQDLILRLSPSRRNQHWARIFRRI